jgi:hypothetical protein
MYDSSILQALAFRSASILRAWGILEIEARRSTEAEALPLALYPIA